MSNTYKVLDINKTEEGVEIVEAKFSLEDALFVSHFIVDKIARSEGISYNEAVEYLKEEEEETTDYKEAYEVMKRRLDFLKKKVSKTTELVALLEGLSNDESEVCKATIETFKEFSDSVTVALNSIIEGDK